MKYLLLLILPAMISCTATYNRNRSSEPERRITFSTNSGGRGAGFTIDFYKGSSFYHPLMAFWIEDSEGRYIQTLYVASSVATGTFIRAKEQDNKWVPGPKRAPQTLPYWAHKRGIKASDGLYMPEPENPVPDAYSGATPQGGFTVETKADSVLPEKIRIMMEINENWDWNNYWTNDKYPDDINYKMSCQPAVVYAAEIDMKNRSVEYRMQPIGHSHYSGKTGELFPDLGTLTTALHIADSVVVKIR